ncbi:hypothetical protein [Mucilaginibacter psychrotolerans]|uniref:AlgX/AlgJ SGNH hydrolase-like domain-containing protein n=1 Tax=Mucilaginibacter psychrotolerans TaxID=1524096 RepID=A0A4Y8SQV3_9SPHI|nr:hypothetical protein [Mucilaginibacter psychrotolerans]TFF40867.1 hypothetical protein E2R66_01440 [Mucilaginibacter psychrotolerans]
MKHKLFGVILLVLSGALLVAAMNQSFINKIKQDRYYDHLTANDKLSLYHRFFVRSDRWRDGDLYGLCYLPRYKHPLEPFKQYTRDRTTTSNRILYIIGDSFLADKTLSGAFDAFDNVFFLDRRFPLPTTALDSTKQNYLMLEFAERNLNDFTFSEADKQPWENKPQSVTTAVKPVTLPTRAINILFNKDLSRNVELLLFDDKIFTPIKEAKAWLNYTLFGRVANEVAVSSNKKRLFLNISVDTSSAQSAFTNRTNKQVGEINHQLKKAGDYYKNIGFKSVFLAAIPNAVSIYDPNRGPYNHLLERVELGNALPVISVYNDYKASRNNLFYISDAHWNPYGLDLWVNKVNKVMQHNLARQQ